MQPGVSAEDFCNEYGPVCTYAIPNRYATKADCMAMYTAAGATGQSCRAGHLCNAKMGNTDVHCPHATGAPPCQ